MRRTLSCLLTIFLGAAAPLSAQTAPQNDPASEPAVIAVSKVWPAVVNVNTERIIKRTYQDPYDQLFNQFFGGTMRPPRELQQKVQSLGSGFLVSPTGYIVTNEHVVERAADMKIHVTLADGKVYEARYVTGDPSKDIALLKVEGGGKAFPYISLADLSPDLLGETVLAVGNPLGYGLSVSRGIVSALKRSVTLDEVEYKDLVQTDAAINPGNSGGPLIDIGGKLVGVNSVKMSFTPQGVPTQGIGFAIPGYSVRDTVKEFMRQAESPGGLKHAGGELSAARKLFGVQLQDLTVDLSDALGVPNGQGVLVSDVDDGGPAHDVGIRAGMVILKIGRYEVNSVGEAETLFSKANSGDEADLTVLVTRRFRGQLIQSEQAVSLRAR